MKKKLEELKLKRAELLEKSKRADVSNDELKTILDEVKKINESISLIEEIANSAVEDENNNTTEDTTGDTTDSPDNTNDTTDGGASRSKRFNPVFKQGDETKSADEKRSLEYRKAFRSLVTKNIPIPAELRESTTTSDVGDVIPENLIAEIIDRSKDIGMIFNEVQHTSYPVGQEIPKANFRPTVKYVAEGTGNANQKAGETTGRIKFSHYKADCRIAWTQETSAMTLEQWETYFVEKVVEAVTYWKENEIVNGKGESQSNITGILSQTPVFAIEKDVLTYTDLLEFEGNLPAKKDSAKWYMSKKTFFNTFKSILDDNGNPVASLNMGTDKKLVYNILGREVVFIDEYIGNHNGAGVKAGQITAFMYDFADYCFNENYNLGIKRRENWENDDMELKAVFACDGKPIYTDSLIVLKRKTEIA